ncbi:MAG: conserved membrane protein of unknown function [Candidatus Thorarchaeota archaeon]|nr:MAG: conserved membrane protein of unknown function [Candidatus Thorarchaeota archaeon]
MAKSDIKKLASLLILLGGLLGLLWGILAILSPVTPIFVDPTSVLNLGLGIIGGVILIVLSLIVLASSGAVSIPALKFANNWIIMLILGVLIYIFGGGLPGILIILGAILMLLA